MKRLISGAVHYAGRLGGLLQLLFREFGRHEGAQNAAALTYTTLLSLVPLMTVTLAVLSAFPVAERVQEVIQSFVFENFVPTSGVVVQEYLQAFSAKASKLSGAGFAFLVIVALMMMANIDRAINAIWEVRRKRRLIDKFLIYWAVLSLGPVLIGSSVVVSSYVISLPIVSDAATSGLGRRMLGLTPVLTSTLAFTLLYMVVPNRRVRLRHALVGGLLGALLFEGAKRLFALYITAFPTYEAIYGALATIPIFLVWVYLTWVVVLLAAEFTHCLSNHHWEEDAGAGGALGLPGMLHLLLALDRAGLDGSGRTLGQLTLLRRNWREGPVEDALASLQDAAIVQRTENGRWLLARRAEDLSLYTVLRSCALPLPRHGEGDWPTGDLGKLFRSADEGLEEVLARPLAAFRQAGGAAPAVAIRPERPGHSSG